MESCVQLWSPQHDKDMELMEWVHRMTTRMIQGLEHLSYERWRGGQVARVVDVQLGEDKAAGRPSSSLLVPEGGL